METVKSTFCRGVSLTLANGFHLQTESCGFSDESLQGQVIGVTLPLQKVVNTHRNHNKAWDSKACSPHFALIASYAKTSVNVIISCLNIVQKVMP